jgi:hypothetical protein
MHTHLPKGFAMSSKCIVMYRRMLKEEALKPSVSPKIIAMDGASTVLTLQSSPVESEG